MHTRTQEVTTGDRRIVDVTDLCAGFAADLGGDGILHAFLPHATAGLALIEVGAGSDQDLADHLDVILPRDDHWRHAHGSRGHGADHLLPALISPSVTVPVEGGRLVLGTWQSIVLVDPNADNPRRTLRLDFLPG